MRPLHTLALRTPIVLAAALLGIGLFASIASAVEPLASRGGSRISTIDPILGTTGILMMTTGLAVMGVTRLRFAPRPLADVPDRAIILQPSTNSPKRSPANVANASLTRLIGSLPRARSSKPTTPAASPLTHRPTPKSKIVNRQWAGPVGEGPHLSNGFG
jgi:hypothetical protein